MRMDAHERFLRLLLAHQEDLKAFIASMVRERAQTEDLFQDVCLALWRGFSGYDPSRPFGAWARGVAAKKILQAWERSRRTPLPFSPEAVRAILDAYDREDPPAGEAEGLRDCIARLPERARRLLALRYERALTLGEVAREVGSTLDAVHKALSRIRAALQECLEGRSAAADGSRG
ncbi:MAG TPA: sigma-70 family RNA polymerase sigma factor [Planctomycetota bacterium]|jgi:RNA polymerase sigma-70 factor (ECF subfamily)|nr:sigma-70 family RNA polymerase sigma factor [Planctomycetota bacterium]